MILNKHMTKQLYKKIIIFPAILLLAFSLSFPVSAKSIFDRQGGKNNDNNNGNKINNGFCQRIDNFFSKADENFVKNQARLENNRLERERNMNQKYADREAKKEQNRVNWDAKRDANLNVLKGRAKTEEQKAAIEKFISAVNNAVSIRRKAVDAALAAFKEGVATVLNGRKVVIDQAIKNFESAKNAVLEKARADCASRIDQKIVRQQTTNGIKAARDKFKEEIKGTAKVGEQVSALTKTKRVALDNAQEDFQKAFEAAKEELKAAFK